jgi:hypothetical protein
MRLKMRSDYVLNEEPIEDQELFTEEQLAEQETLRQENAVKRQAIELVVKEFFEKNEQAKALDKALKPMNADIKSYFRSADEKSILIDDILAEYSVRSGASTMNADALLAKLKKLKLKHLIKKVEVINMAAFEKLIYDQLLDANLFTDCIVTGSSSEVLVIKKKKAKKSKKDDVE